MVSYERGLARGSSETHVIIAVATKGKHRASQSMKPRSASTARIDIEADAAAPPVGREIWQTSFPPARSSLSIRRGKRGKRAHYPRPRLKLGTQTNDEEVSTRKRKRERFRPSGP